MNVSCFDDDIISSEHDSSNVYGITSRFVILEFNEP